MLEIVWGNPHDVIGDLSWLAPWEHERLQLLQRDDDQARFTAGHNLLRVVVARIRAVRSSDVSLYAMCPRCGGATHGPVVVDVLPGQEPLHVSLSHVGDRVLVAVADVGPVGVDVDQVARFSFDGFDTVALADSERADLSPMEPSARQQARATLWVRKEAVLKATGDGLAVDPRQLVVSAPSAPPELLEWASSEAPAPADIQLFDLPAASGYVAAVAVLSADRVSPSVGQLR